MNLTEAAHALFDTTIAPLARKHQAANTPSYFATGPDASATSYFVPVGPATTGRQVAALPGGGHADGLIEALAAFWTERGEADLAAMAPGLHELAEAVAAERSQQSGDVDIYCYTMF